MTEKTNGFVRWKDLAIFTTIVVGIVGGAGAYAISANIGPVRSDISELKADMRDVHKMVTEILVGKNK